MRRLAGASWVACKATASSRYAAAHPYGSMQRVTIARHDQDDIEAFDQLGLE